MRATVALLLGLCAATAFFAQRLAAQKPFKEYPGQWTGFPLPPDWNVPHDWVFGRLRYQNYGGGGGGFGFRGRGGRGGAWSTDYPRGDRHVVEGLRRLTRVDIRSVEQVIDLDQSDDVYNWPFLYGVEVGRWQLNDEQARQLRDFIDRGGFFMVDDFHGTQQWQIFEESFQKVFPDRQLVDLPGSDHIYHLLYDLKERFQIPGNQFLYSGNTYEQDGYEPIWRGVYDDKQRLIAVVCANMDLGDAVERSDEPTYPEKYASLAYRIFANYMVYDLTH